VHVANLDLSRKSVPADVRDTSTRYCRSYWDFWPASLSQGDYTFAIKGGEC
jgi:hypothetical protein